MTTTTAYLLYLAFALGGVAVYLLLPKPDRSQAASGAVFGVLALVALMAVLAARVVAPGNGTVFFYIFATIAVFGAVRVITHPKPVYSALYFVLVVVAVAALLVLLHADFLAVASIIIYAGAILVTYLFVIMLADQGGSPLYDRRSREPFLSVLAGFLLMAAIAGQVQRDPSPVAAGDETVRLAGAVGPVELVTEGNTSGVGALVMTKHVVALEISGVLLLVSMIGAIALSRKKVPTEGLVGSPRPLGQIGKEVEPY